MNVLVVTYAIYHKIFPDANKENVFTFSVSKHPPRKKERINRVTLGKVNSLKETQEERFATKIKKEEDS